jgi:hypothetical protein
MHAIYLADGMLVHQCVALDGEERHVLRMLSWIPARVIHEEPEMLVFGYVALDGRVRRSLATRY